MRVTKTSASSLPLRYCSRILSARSEEHTSELQSRSDLVCRLLLEKKKTLHFGAACSGRGIKSWFTSPAGRFSAATDLQIAAARQQITQRTPTLPRSHSDTLHAVRP